MSRSSFFVITVYGLLILPVFDGTEESGAGHLGSQVAVVLPNRVDCWAPTQDALIEPEALARAMPFFPGVSPTEVDWGPWFCDAHELGIVRPTGFLLHVVFIGILNRAAVEVHGEGHVLLISEDGTLVAKVSLLMADHDVRLSGSVLYIKGFIPIPFCTLEDVVGAKDLGSGGMHRFVEASAREGRCETIRAVR